MSSESLSLDDFMSHSTTSARGTFLKKWKERRPVPPATKPTCNTVLLMQDSIYVLYRHDFPRVHVMKETNEKVVWSGNYVCSEEEKVLKNMYRRDNEDRRTEPPKTCGACKLIEWTYQQILDGKLSWTEPVFRFEADNAKNTKLLHAGGICNMFAKKDMPPEDKQDLAKHGIYQKNAWAENCLAKAKYLLLVVDFDDPQAGVQIAIESSSLGSAIRGVIHDRRISKGQDEGNPFINPFVIQWEYDPNDGVAFGDKYHARAIDRVEYDVTKRPDILDLVRSSPPDTSNIRKPFNPQELRMALEEAALIQFPWDEFFGPLQVQPDQVKVEEKSQTPSLNKAVGTATVSKAAVVYTDEDPGCPKCDKPCKDEDKSCPHCGAVFEVEAAPPPPPVQRRKKGVAVAQAPAAGKPVEVPPKTIGGAGMGLPDDEGDVPFAYMDATTIGERWWRT
jgi:hypothetical protein